VIFSPELARWDGGTLSPEGKIIAKRAGLNGFELHRWRKTSPPNSMRAGSASAKIQSYLGHTKLDVTLIYLGVSDAADEASQEQINNSTLAAFA